MSPATLARENGTTLGLPAINHGLRSIRCFEDHLFGYPPKYVWIGGRMMEWGEYLNSRPHRGITATSELSPSARPLFAV